jgi:4-hydroxybenzoate polyprenyltransferase
MAMLRTYLTLGRVSNLPTVWSNCFAGWLLGGGGAWDRLLLVSMGGTFLYLAGMYLNDAFDAQWDQQRRPERPIPSGAIALTEVWQLGLLGMAAGVGTLALLGRTLTILALLLAACIFVYDAIHKIFAFSPVLMAVCRLLLVLAGASSGDAGIPGLAIWSALVLAFYVVGLSFLAQTESTRGSLRYWPCLFLGAPVALALVVNSGASSALSVGDLVDLPLVASKLRQPADAVAIYLRGRLSAKTLNALANYQGLGADPAPLETALVEDLNRILSGRSIHDAQRFADVALRPETQLLLARNPQGNALLRLNRLLLEDAYPLEISRNHRSSTRVPGILWSGVLFAWAVTCLRFAYWTPQRNVAHSVAGLLAGIVLVDLLAVCVVPAAFGSAFVGLFVGALFLQRLIPAT